MNGNEQPPIHHEIPTTEPVAERPESQMRRELILRLIPGAALALISVACGNDEGATATARSAQVATGTAARATADTAATVATSDQATKVVTARNSTAASVSAVQTESAQWYVDQKTKAAATSNAQSTTFAPTQESIDATHKAGTAAANKKATAAQATNEARPTNTAEPTLAKPKGVDKQPIGSGANDSINTFTYDDEIITTDKEGNIISRRPISTATAVNNTPTPPKQVSPEPSPTPQPPSPTPRIENPFPPPPENENAQLVLDRNREKDLFQSSFGIRYFPDTNTTILRNTNGELSAFITGNVQSYLLTGPDIFHLRPPRPDSSGNAIPVLSPDGSAQFGRNYRGFGAIVPGRTAQELIGIFHGENWPSGQGNFQASIGLATSQDGGVTWQNPTQILGGRSEASPGSSVTGMGQPSAICMPDNLYVLGTDWSGKSRAPIADAIHLARAPLQNAINPNAWEKYVNGGFKNGGIHGESTPIILPSGPDAHYAALPSVSYNTYLQEFIVLYESNDGFWLVRGKDLTQLGDPQKIFSFNIDQQGRRPGQVWYSYPTLYSEGTPSSQVTDKTGYLICSKGVQNDLGGHRPVAIPFSFA